ncbi:hypothetical protein EEB14_50750 [Rhodococcus sp. WS4]|nr:hypothetical protein EEB14_50750 [Rhodococcus sp. WS4]
MRNRLADPRRQHVIGAVSQLVDGIARQDRWTIARRSTGQLLDHLLSHSGDPAFTYRSGSCSLGVDGAPVAVVEDDDTAVVLGGVRSSTGRDPIPVAAVLVASTAAPRTWLVASLDIATAVDNDFQRAIQHGRFSETIDADIIARHSPLDTRAAAIDWDDPTVVLRKSSNGTTTVADALSELAEWDQRAWTWIADECPTFGGLYLRARHPELVRQY